jgi:hypothetical protein
VTLPATTPSNAAVNGNGHHPMSPSSEPGAAQPRPIVNGVHPAH